MEHYSRLALRYLKQNRARGRVTLLGVVVTTVIFTVFLNLMWCYLLQTRRTAREAGDYEAVLFTQTEAQAQELLQDSRIKSAYIGSYYYSDVHGEQEDAIYPNSLYINVRHPYALEREFAVLCSAYGVEGELNDDVAESYFQGSYKDMPIVLLLFSLLVAYILVIFGVGIVRNAIQLSALEQIRDYGNLRCIGATGRQLKGLMYLQGAILELLGIGIGLLLGVGISLGAAAVLKWPLSFQPLIVPLMLVFFLGDLYFTMGENSKLIFGMSPVSAIRGEYRIKKETIKPRRSRLFGKLFGMEGDYAYKSLMRNPKRFYRTTAAMALGITLVMVITGMWSSVHSYFQDIQEQYGYYQLYYINSLGITESVEDVQASLPATEQLAGLLDYDEVTESKREYSADVWLADYAAFYANYTEEYQNEYGRMDMGAINETFDAARNSDADADIQGSAGIYATTSLPRTCYGYDEAELARCRSALTAGTTDVSEHGIILINPLQNTLIETENGYTYRKIRTMDYQLGDTIDIVNMAEFRIRLEPQLTKIEADGEEQLAELRAEYGVSEDGASGQDDTEAYAEYQRAHDLLETEICQRKAAAAFVCWDALVQEGNYTTYTIEGIVSQDPNQASLALWGEAGFILPLEQYYTLTGTNEAMNTGMMYHVRNGRVSEKLSTKYAEAAVSSQLLEEDTIYKYEVEANEDISGYPTVYAYVRTARRYLWGGAAMLLFVILMSALNFINTTASNLHLRRREFAQLSVLGATQRTIWKVTLLEGIITTILADGIGVALGCAVSAWLYYYVTQLILLPYHFPWGAIPVCILASVLLLVGAIYVPMRRRNPDMLDDLTCGGD